MFQEPREFLDEWLMLIERSSSKSRSRIEATPSGLPITEQHRSSEIIPEVKRAFVIKNAIFVTGLPAVNRGAAWLHRPQVSRGSDAGGGGILHVHPEPDTAWSGDRHTLRTPSEGESLLLRSQPTVLAGQSMVEYPAPSSPGTRPLH
jgi:hypothetical protein